VFKLVSVLSGGERARLTLSKLILSKMNVLVLDEPTNHLDIDSREALEGALEDFDGTIIAVSHDRYFIEKLSTRIIELKPDGYVDGDMFDYNIVNVGRGYTEFREFVENRKQNMGATDIVVTTSESKSKEDYLKSKQDAADARRRANRLQKLQKEMEKLESELLEVEEALMGEAAYDYKKAAELDCRKNEIEERLMEIYEELEQ
jgi:ATP-binding cassette subfamily F protein 3